MLSCYRFAQFAVFRLQSVFVAGVGLSLSIAQACPLSLTQYLKQVHDYNLDLKIERAKTEALHAESKGFRVPPPQVSVAFMTEQTGHQSKDFLVRQMIPFPTKIFYNLSARKNAYHAQEQNLILKTQEVLSQARLAYWRLWEAQERHLLLIDKQKILQEHVRLTRSTVRSDSFAAVHLLKAESDLDFMESEILEAKQDLLEKRNEAELLILSADQNSAKKNYEFQLQEPTLSELPLLHDKPAYSLQVLQSQLEEAQSKEKEALSSWLPDFEFQYKHAGATSMMPPSQEVMVGVTLPFLYFWNPASEKRQASSEKLKKEFELEKERVKVNVKVENLTSKANTLRAQIEVYQTKLIPKAEKRVKIVHNVAPRDMETLQDHRETLEALPDLKLKTLDLKIQYEKTVAELEQTFGIFKGDKTP